MESANQSEPGHTEAHGGGLFTRMREAMGTVYGDIGTSVLYTIMEITRETIRLKHRVGGEEELTAFLKEGGDFLSAQEALGGFSLVLWALIFLTVKYDLLIMKADNRGEGGTFALWGLLKGYTGKVVGISVIGYLVVAAAGPARGRRRHHAADQHARGLRAAGRAPGRRWPPSSACSSCSRPSGGARARSAASSAGS